MSYTVARLPVSPEAYEEIRRKLEAAGYGHALKESFIDMHGLALEPEKGPDTQAFEAVDHAATFKPGIRRFRAWCCGAEGNNEIENVELENVSDKQATEYMDDYVQTMIANNVDAGWNEID